MQTLLDRAHGVEPLVFDLTVGKVMDLDEEPEGMSASEYAPTTVRLS